MSHLFAHVGTDITAGQRVPCTHGDEVSQEVAGTENAEMTFQSLSVQLYPAGQSGEQLSAAGATSQKLVDLDHLAHRCGPYGLADWAGSVGLKVYYVDNAWCRVPVSGAMLLLFASDVLKAPEAVAQMLDCGRPREGQLVIEAEEF